MLSVRVFRLYLFLLICCSACFDRNRRNGQLVKEKIEILELVDSQCPGLVLDEFNNWVEISSGGGLYEFKYQGVENKLLRVYKDSISNVLRGYFDIRTDSSYMNFRLLHCDTVIFFKIINSNLGQRDTIFHKGYYKFLYDEGMLNSGQRKFYRKNKDSLIYVSGGNLKTLPELSR